MMKRHRKLSARILSIALSAALVCTMIPATTLAEEGDIPRDENSMGTIKSFDKLESRFTPSKGKNAPNDVYALPVELDTPYEDLELPDELGVIIERTTTVTDSTASDDEPVASPSDPEREVIEEKETTVTVTEHQNISVIWNSEAEYRSDEKGKFIYTAELPEGYTLADSVKLPQIHVTVGRQARSGGMISQRTTSLNLYSDETVTWQGGSGNPVTSDLDALSSEGWKWEHESKTLTLNGIDLNVKDTFGLLVPGGTVVILEGGSKNSIISGIRDTYALGSTGALRIEGPGNVALRGSRAGIQANDIKIVEGAEVMTDGYVGALATAGGIFIEHSNVTASGTEVALYSEDGIINVESGIIFAGDAAPGADVTADPQWGSNYKWVKVSHGEDSGLNHDINAGSLAVNPGDSCSGSNPHVVTGTTERNTITVRGGEHWMTLNEVNIDVSEKEDACALEIQGDALVNLTLADGKTNTLKSGKNRAGIQAETRDEKTASLTIDGTGTLDITGGETGAGIGGSGNYKGGKGYGDGGIITIHNGTITVNGGDMAAGIGAGLSQAGGTITITGGIVTARGGSEAWSQSGAGIGGAGTAGTVVITGGMVAAIGGNYSAGIGAGCDSVTGEAGIVKIGDQAMVIAVAYGDLTNAIDSADGNMAPVSGNAANILAINYAEAVDADTITEIRDSSDAALDPAISYVPEGKYHHIAFTLPSAGSYTVYKGGVKQQGDKDAAAKLTAFDVAAGLNNYSNMSDALPVPAPSVGSGSSKGATSYLRSIPKDYRGTTKVLHNTIVPDYVVEGNWVPEADGNWKLTGKNGDHYKDVWVPAYNPYANVTAGQSAFDWFLFDKEGYLITGWYTDSQGTTYYLNPVSNNIKGAMAAGWVQLDGKYYYFNNESDGTRGKLYRNATTPDGYDVDETGAWNGKEK